MEPSAVSAMDGENRERGEELEQAPQPTTACVLKANTRQGSPRVRATERQPVWRHHPTHVRARRQAEERLCATELRNQGMELM